MRRIHLTSLLALSLLVGACTPAPDAPLAEPPDIVEDSRKPVIELATIQKREPYKTALINDAEVKLGRFPEGVSGGSMTRMTHVEPRSFNPYANADSFVWEISDLLWRGLAEMDYYTGDATPDLAAEITVHDDGVTYTTRLRKGLKWSDGKPITAEDVAFTWNTILGKGYGNSPIREAVMIDGVMPTVTVLDPLTVRFVTKRPYVPFKRQLTNPILPKHIFEPMLAGKEGRKQFMDLWSNQMNPTSIVTSGPFTLEQYLPGQRIEFRRRPDFYMFSPSKEARLPYFDQLVYLIVPGVDAAVPRLKSGDIDIAHLPDRSVADMRRRGDSPSFKLFDLGPSMGSFFLTFNMNKRIDPKTNNPFVDAVRCEWFNDRNFRQAVNHAVNRGKIAKICFDGYGLPSYSCLPHASPWFNKSIEPFTQDLSMSEKFLAESRFTKNSHGDLLDAAGNRVEFDLIYPDSAQLYESAARMVRDDLRQLGIKVNIRKFDFETISHKIHQGNGWEAVLFSVTQDPAEPQNSANIYRSNGNMHIFDQREADGSGNITVTDLRPWEEKIDQIFALASAEFDKEKRRVLFDELQQVMYHECPMVFLAGGKVFVGANGRIGNWEPTPLSQPVSGAHNIEELYRKTEAKAP